MRVQADIAPALFRELLGRFATGVTVMTAANAGGLPHGMTVSSVASVSLTPPLVSACIGDDAVLHDLLVDAPLFALSILSEHQETLSRRFAGPVDTPFDGVGYHLSEHGLALIDGAVAHIECRREAVHPAGDHSIVIGRVIGGSASDGRPLIHFRGGYTTLG